MPLGVDVVARGTKRKEGKKNNSGANLGFEASLWHAADALRGGNSTPTPITFASLGSPTM